MSAIAIARERPDAPEASALVLELEEHLAARYAPESRHGFSVERLVAEGVALYVARVDGAPAGCGGILLVDGPTGRFGEVKRMFVRPAYRGRGLGRRILARLEAHVLEAGHRTMRLETGVFETAAIGLYETHGFVRIPPFPPYVEDPVSRCYERSLDASG